MDLVGRYEALPKTLRDQMENRFLWAVHEGQVHPDATVEKAVATIIAPLHDQLEGAVSVIDAAHRLANAVTLDLDRSDVLDFAAEYQRAYNTWRGQ
jgi:hypothetical protein